MYPLLCRKQSHQRIGETVRRRILTDAPRLRCAVALIILLAIPVHAATPKVPPPGLEKEVIEDLPPPYDFHAEVYHKSVSLSWNWTKPELLPVFNTFGYEVMRGTQTLKSVPVTAFGDVDLSTGTYVYQVRARGDAKEGGKRVSHISAWTEPQTITITMTCASAPAVHLNVSPVRREVGTPSAVRFRLTGDIHVPAGCTLVQAGWHVDTGTGIKHSGPLVPDANGHFQEFVNAIGTEDEPPSGDVAFKITATAEDEAGPVTSDEYTITLQLENPFAPKTEH